MPALEVYIRPKDIEGAGEEADSYDIPDAITVEEDWIQNKTTEEQRKRKTPMNMRIKRR